MNETTGTPIYLDNQATTPVDPRVVQAMLPYFTSKFGNLASQHSFGLEVRESCRNARANVAEVIGCSDPLDIIFTSGATESNNLALKGIAEGSANRGTHIVSCVTEHKCVLDSLKHLSSKGFEITLLPVDSAGRINVSDVCQAIRTGESGKDRTILVSLMGANNEIGTLHPIQEIGQALHEEFEVFFHVDAAQTFGKSHIDIKKSHIDLLSMSAHKIYGPKGIGALYLNRKKIGKALSPQVHGGGQEGGLRAGTLPVALVVGFGAAARCALDEMQSEHQEISALRHRLWQGIQKLGDCELNGDPTERLAGNLSVTFHFLDGEQLMFELGKHVAVSSTSACSSASGGSHVLSAIGRTEDEAIATIRFGIGRFNGVAEINRTLDLLNEFVPRLRHAENSRRKKYEARLVV